jgi:hypothetical protein
MFWKLHEYVQCAKRESTVESFQCEIVNENEKGNKTNLTDRCVSLQLAV